MLVKSIARPVKLAFLASIAAAAAVAIPSFAANSTSATVTATVVVPISISKTADLSFGKFYTSTAGTITINTAGAPSVGGGTVTTGGTPSAAAFAITGEPNAGYTISMTGTSTTLTGPGSPMTLALISDFITGTSTGTKSTGILDPSGAQTLYVGGTLTVGAAQTNGAYNGSIAVAVNYQ